MRSPDNFVSDELNFKTETIALAKAHHSPILLPSRNSVHLFCLITAQQSSRWNLLSTRVAFKQKIGVLSSLKCETLDVRWHSSRVMSDFDILNLTHLCYL